MTTKQFILLFNAALFSLTGSAQTFDRVSENAEATFYVNKSTLNRNGKIADFWQVIDYKNQMTDRQGKKYGSMEMHMVIDCEAYSQTLIYMKVYSGNIARGTLIASGSMKQSNSIPIGSTLEAVRNYVCR